MGAETGPGLQSLRSGEAGTVAPEQSSTMNQMTPDRERAPAVVRGHVGATLVRGGDPQEHPELQTISRTHEIKKQVDRLIQETKATDCHLHSVFNDFLMLATTQCIETEKTQEQKEVDLIPKVQEAVNYGLQVLDSAFEQLDRKAGNSDSEDDDVNEQVGLILERKVSTFSSLFKVVRQSSCSGGYLAFLTKPFTAVHFCSLRDLYIDHPLPYLIGSKLFMEQEDVGLGELSSEEGSVGHDQGSIVDSEEEEESDLFREAPQEWHTPNPVNEGRENDGQMWLTALCREYVLLHSDTPGFSSSLI
ncbi:Protein FAM21 [Heterocephalus glaber]|uniref:Protein FAM21 n=1 Tax=Heterocephalus glaber TaxID=10181 RepID=G5AVZ4_HETGA|nr:Protein FAM21 [Heterocephalus glaber]